ncbi:MAG: heparan-alpha-glucosaminide N-acetyltransferase domain-containing protein [Gemmatimonadota bacterium]
MTVTAAAPNAHPSIDTQRSYRLRSIDIVRGVVMILMAIDHVRVFSGVPAGGPTAGVFFTRWVTHFVAPAFVFLAGTAAFLHGTHQADRGRLAVFLFTRGVWLVLLELTVIRVAWTFNFDFGNYLLAGVIWVIGCCMMLMAALVYLPTRVVGLFGVAVIALHNLLPASNPWDGESGIWLWQLLYDGGSIGPLVILYTIVPWIGVMAAGFGFGAVLQRPTPERRALCIRLGLGMIALFLLLRAFDLYGDSQPWRADYGAPPFVRFLNTAKYPASFQFLLMTMGPTILAVGLLEHARGRVATILATFGRVPLFYYLMHIPAIHIAAVIVSAVRSAPTRPTVTCGHCHSCTWSPSSWSHCCTSLADGLPA